MNNETSPIVSDSVCVAGTLPRLESGFDIRVCLFLFGLGVLSYSLARSGKPKYIVIGNMVSFAISYGIALSVGEGYGEGYFKPLTASQLVLGVSVLNLVVQIPIVMNAIQNKVMKKELEGHDG